MNTITEAIQFEAEIRQVKSMVDHTFNVTINIPEYHLEQAQELMGMLGDMIAVAVVRIETNQE